MKKLNILMIMLISSIVFMACEKEETDSFTKSEQKIEDNIERTQELPPFHFELKSCMTDDGNFGAGCWAMIVEECPEPVPCQELVNDEGDPIPLQTIQEEFGFTDDEMDNWQDGSDIFEPTVDFVQDHYNFYIHLYNSGITFHPDTIISNIEG